MSTNVLKQYMCREIRKMQSKRFEITKGFPDSVSEYNKDWYCTGYTRAVNDILCLIEYDDISPSGTDTEAKWSLGIYEELEAGKETVWNVHLYTNKDNPDTPTCHFEGFIKDRSTIDTIKILVKQGFISNAISVILNENIGEQA